ALRLGRPARASRCCSRSPSLRPPLAMRFRPTGRRFDPPAGDRSDAQTSRTQSPERSSAGTAARLDFDALGYGIQVRLAARREAVADAKAERQPELLQLAHVRLEGGEVGPAEARVEVASTRTRALLDGRQRGHRPQLVSVDSF